MLARIVILVLLGGFFLIFGGCSSNPRSAESIPLSSAPRRVLKVCASKDKLTRADLTLLARRYSVIEDGEPSLVEILRLNEKCRVGPDVEQLDLTRAGCISENKAVCKTGIVLVPIR